MNKTNKAFRLGIDGDGEWKVLINPKGGKTAMWVTQDHLDAFEEFIVEKYNDYKYGLGHDYVSWYRFLEVPYKKDLWVIINPNKLEDATRLF